MDMKLNRHTLHHGDCLDVLNTLPKNHFDLVVTDPPWHTTDLDIDHKNETNEYGAIYRQVYRVLKPAGWFFCWSAVKSIHEVARAGFRHKFEYVWYKPRPNPKTKVTVRPYYQHEMIYAFIKADLKRMSDLYFDPEPLRTQGRPYTSHHHPSKASEFTRQTRRVPLDEAGYEKKHIHRNTGYREGTTILHHVDKTDMAKSERTGHPTQKPISLYELIIRGYCPSGGRILDPFAGSGTCLMAADRTGRDSVSVEIDQKYYEGIIHRYKTRSSLNKFT